MRAHTTVATLLALGATLGGTPARATVPLALTADASFLGAAADDLAGSVVAAAGDVDGDGLDDLLITAPWADGPLSDVGSVYLVLGRNSDWSLNQPLSAPDTLFDGEFQHDLLGQAVAGLGDVDGDGFDDLLFAAPRNYMGTGKVYVVFGQAGGFNPYELIAYAAGASYLGQVTGDRAGAAVAGPGDVTGDGLADLWIGAPDADGSFASSGVVYLVAGREMGWGPNTGLGLADASFGGTDTGEGAGNTVAGAGDVNGDGLPDLLVGAQDSSWGGSGAGQVYLIFGRTLGWAFGDSLANADASFLGEQMFDHAGAALCAAGDVDGDGFDDLLIGARDNDEVDSGAGKVYLVFGGDSGWAMHTGLVYADASFLGEAGGDLAGQALAGGGDVNGDGLDDLLIGASVADGGLSPFDRGRAYLFLGRPTAEWWPGMSVIEANAVFDGEAAGDQAGRALAFVGDAGGDGLDDLLIGAPGRDEGFTDAGKASLVLGFPCGDVDQDGVDVCWGDCDDNDDTIYPGAAETCGDGIDSDCDGDLTEDMDLDGDGFTPCEGDCDDGDTLTHPGAIEICDLMDNNCDGVLPLNESEDLDGDGWVVCMDCDDGDWSTFPGAPELCDGLDNDCDGLPASDETDDDGDGAMPCGGDCDDTDPALNPDDDDGDGQSTCEGDCDDTNPDVYLGNVEICGDGVDGDCLDDLYLEIDDDGDGWAECEGDCDDSNPDLHPGDEDGDGMSPCFGDCDDGDPNIYLGAPDPCEDVVDSDCMGNLWIEIDDDGDGFAECAGDCNDNNAAIFPGATELCDMIDSDCDGLSDAAEDQDGDGHGLCGPDGYPGNDDDCDDHHPGVHPGAPEICDGIDNNCNDWIDEGFDLDGDGYSSCNGEDCNDDPLTGDTIYPGAPEIPYDGIDQDCAGGDLVDVDGDGALGGPNGQDCDDLRAAVHPGAVEDCTDGLDGDCDGLPDSDDPDCLDTGCSCRTDGAARGPAAAILVLLALGWVRRERRQ